jgi:hypothetical protein
MGNQNCQLPIKLTFDIRLEYIWQSLPRHGRVAPQHILSRFIGSPLPFIQLNKSETTEPNLILFKLKNPASKMSITPKKSGSRKILNHFFE